MHSQLAVLCLYLLRIENVHIWESEDISADPGKLQRPVGGYMFGFKFGVRIWLGLWF